jgi:uncharacterized membrane protein
MADVKRTTRRARRAAKDQVSDAGDQVKDTAEQARDAGGDVADEAQDTARGAGEQASGVADQARDVAKREGDGGAPTLRSELQDTIREAAIEVLRPLARTATKSAASYAVTKGPQLLAKRVIPKIADAGGAEGIAQNVKDKGSDLASRVGTAAGGVTERLNRGGKDSDSESGRSARLPVMESVDIGVGLQTAYDQFTQFEDWPEFMQHVDEVEQRDDSTLMFHGRLWGLGPGWEAEIVEQAPFERIVWRGTDEGEAVVVATFHRLSDNLTRIQVDLDTQPQGLVERLSAVSRMSTRALRSDLQRLKAFLELRDEATGGWRGRIEDAEVVEEPYDEEEPEAADVDEEEPEASQEEEEPEASEEDYEEPEADAEEEEPEASEEDYEEPEADAEEEEPEASDEDDEAEEPAARADDEEEEEEEEEEPQPAPRRRTRQSPAKKAPARQSPAKKAPARKSPAKKAPARQPTAKKTPSRQSAAKKTPSRQSAAKKAPARRRTTASSGS